MSEVVHDLKVRRLGVFGAEVQGIDLAHATRMEIDDIKKAWYRHDVLLFRNQQLTDDDLLSFSRHFGALDSPPNQGAGRKSPPGYPEVYIVSNRSEEHTSELQSQSNLVCRLLLEKKKTKNNYQNKKKKQVERL